MRKKSIDPESDVAVGQVAVWGRGKIREILGEGAFLGF